jgi:hypothetical protein
MFWAAIAQSAINHKRDFSFINFCSDAVQITIVAAGNWLIPGQK